MTLWIDCILAGIALEALILALLQRRWPRIPPPAALLPNLAGGAFLLLAMRLALAGAWWPWVSATLLGGLGAHLIDLRHRVRN